MTLQLERPVIAPVVTAPVVTRPQPQRYSIEKQVSHPVYFGGDRTAAPIYPDGARTTIRLDGADTIDDARVIAWAYCVDDHARASGPEESPRLMSWMDTEENHPEQTNGVGPLVRTEDGWWSFVTIDGTRLSYSVTESLHSPDISLTVTRTTMSWHRDITPELHRFEVEPGVVLGATAITVHIITENNQTVDLLEAEEYVEVLPNGDHGEIETHQFLMGDRPVWAKPYLEEAYRAHASARGRTS